jgi:uncharacterized protein YidB (DUF937 family)
MSGLFGSVLGQLGGLLGGQSGQAGIQESAQASAGGLLAQVINAAGGPAGIAQKFQQAGLGEKVQSWIGTGHNLPVSAEEITKVFPPEQIDAMAQRFGLPAGVASQVLAQFLPHAVDTTTPDGTVPPPDSPQADTSKIDFASMIGRLAGGGR